MKTGIDEAPALIIGGTGKTGHRVVKGLIERGYPVRIGSRNAALPFDWNAPETWAPAVAGTAAVYITYQPDLAVPGAVDVIRDFAAVALAEGVTRLVLLSGRGEPEAEEAEQALIESGADWTIIRASWFMQNFCETFLYDALKTGELALPVNSVKEPFVDVEDIAAVAVAALTMPGHSGKLYEVTGPDLLSFEEAVSAISEAAGRRIGFRRVSPDDYAGMLRGAGVSPEEISLLLYLFTTVLDGRNANSTDGVRQALGREPGSFAGYVSRTAMRGVWSEPQQAIA
ncbi:NAD(P)H-binding protein [Nisaea acidiphila]|uniref:NAD(P)H-binding protein n=1 Tax=Nisaea acidiphila TaxID=1862145 RepID=A0A9J7ANG1_9PROT|nr:NAD(P)H-binding protein [Nisaea acidiphila]UUX48727.1 NAD(P)H-binding protein [Nisaea acidiphila]